MVDNKQVIKLLQENAEKDVKIQNFIQECIVKTFFDYIDETHDATKLDDLDIKSMFEHTYIVQSRLFLGSSDMKKFLEERIVKGLDTYYKCNGQDPDVELSNYEIKILASVLDFLLEPTTEEDEHVGIKIDTLNVTIKDESIHGEEIMVHEFSPDIAWAGLVQLSSGQLLKIVMQGFYITESMDIL